MFTIVSGEVTVQHTSAILDITETRIRPIFHLHVLCAIASSLDPHTG